MPGAPLPAYALFVVGASVLQAGLDGGDDARPQLVGADDGVDRADRDGAVDAVHRVELGRHLAELLGPHRRAQLGELGGERAPARTPDASASRRLELGHARVGAVRASTSREKTTAAAGAPPMTEANEPSTASTVMRGLSALEKTTNAPPW